MRLNDDGRYATAPNETITIRTILQNTPDTVPNLTSFPDQAQPCGSQVSTSRPDQKTAIGSFKMPATVGAACALDVTYDFEPDDQGGFPADLSYTVTLVGTTPTGQVTTIDDDPFTPPPSDRNYDFVVEAA